jgi:hypothetical protein
VQGVGGPQLAKVSAEVLKWKDKKGNSGTFQPFIISGLQLCLQGRDIMQFTVHILHLTKDILDLQAAHLSTISLDSMKSWLDKFILVIGSILDFRD